MQPEIRTSGRQNIAKWVSLSYLPWNGHVGPWQGMCVLSSEQCPIAALRQMTIISQIISNSTFLSKKLFGQVRWTLRGSSARPPSFEAIRTLGRRATLHRWGATKNHDFKNACRSIQNLETHSQLALWCNGVYLVSTVLVILSSTCHHNWQRRREINTLHSWGKAIGIGSSCPVPCQAIPTRWFRFFL